MFRTQNYQVSEEESAEDFSAFVLGRYARNVQNVRTVKSISRIPRASRISSSPRRTAPKSLRRLSKTRSSSSEASEKKIEHATEFVKHLSDIVHPETQEKDTTSNPQRQRYQIKQILQSLDLRRPRVSPPKYLNVNIGREKKFVTHLSDVFPETQEKETSLDAQHYGIQQSLECVDLQRPSVSQPSSPSENSRSKKKFGKRLNDIDLLRMQETETSSDPPHYEIKQTLQSVNLQRPSESPHSPRKDNIGVEKRLDGIISPLKKNLQLLCPMPCPCCGSINGNVTETNLGIWALGSFRADVVYSNDFGVETFVELERLIKERR